jgi:hypothetical protein
MFESKKYMPIQSERAKGLHPRTSYAYTALAFCRSNTPQRMKLFA